MTHDVMTTDLRMVGVDEVPCLGPWVGCKLWEPCSLQGWGCKIAGKPAGLGWEKLGAGALQRW